MEVSVDVVLLLLDRNFRLDWKGQGLVATQHKVVFLGPLKFIAYTEDLPAVIEKSRIGSYLYGDDG